MTQISTGTNNATLGFESVLWNAADKLRGHLDAADYKSVVLGLIFLKYISDAFEERYEQLLEEQTLGADPEDKDEYTAEGVFWVPKEARWNALKSQAVQPEIGSLIDAAMDALERENPHLKNVLPKGYARPMLDKRRLGELVNLIDRIGFKEDRARDILGRVYEYFLSQFASAEGKKGGEFYTPQSVVRVIVEMLAPYKGRIYDPCCGSGGMFVQSEKFVEAHGGSIGDISIFGQESNPNTWRLAQMNLAIRGIDANLGTKPADTFHENLHPDGRFDYILANPPFNISDWGGKTLAEDRRWQYGTPPVSNANYAWVQHMLYHLAPNGIAGFVLANGSLSSNTSGEGEIRQNIIEADLVDCVVAMPGQLFYSTQIPVSLWFLARNKKNGKGQEGKPLRDRSGETLLINARDLGYMEDRTHRNLTRPEDVKEGEVSDIEKIVSAYHRWRGDGEGEYEDIPGFCYSASLEDIKGHGYVLTPGRYVGIEEVEDDGEPFEVKMPKLVAELNAQFEESAGLEQQIKANLARLGFE